MTRFASLLCVLLCALPLPAAADDGIKLTQAGTGPTAPLRYAFKKGQKVTGTVASSMTMKLTMGGQTAPENRLPDVTQTVSLVVSTANGSGTFGFTGSITKVTVAKGGEPNITKALEEQFKTLAGSKFSFTMSNRGVVSDVNVELTKDAPPQLRDTVDGTLNAIRQLIPVLPEEPVGAGAEWTSRAELKVGFVTAQQDGTYKLTARKGDSITVEASTKQSAPRQRVAMPGMPPGQTAELTSLAGTSTGSSTVSLGKVGSVGKLASKVKMAISAQGQSMQMEMGADMALKL